MDGVGVWSTHVAGAQQNLKGSGLGMRGMFPGKLWDRFWAGIWHRLVAGIAVSWIWWHGQVAGIPEWCGSAGWRPAWLRDGYLTICGSGTGLWSGTA
jgi:hypothetical protein